MATEIKREFNIDAKLVVGEEGVFDVIVDGKTVFSKAKTDRFPDPGEVATEIKKGR